MRMFVCTFHVIKAIIYLLKNKREDEGAQNMKEKCMCVGVRERKIEYFVADVRLSSHFVSEFC